MEPAMASPTTSHSTAALRRVAIRIAARALNEQVRSAEEGFEPDRTVASRLAGGSRLRCGYEAVDIESVVASDGPCLGERLLVEAGSTGQDPEILALGIADDRPRII